MKRLPILFLAFATGLGLMLTFNAVTTSAQTPALPIPGSAPTPVETPVAKLTIVGRIVNETAGGTLPITTTVLLFGYDGQNLALSTAAVADAAGNVRFEGVENEPGRSFGLAATVGHTFYSGQLQVPKTGARELALTLKTYGTTADASQVRVAQMYVLGEFLSDRELQIFNVYILSNQGDRAVEGGEQAPDGRAATLRFTLPREAAGVKFYERNADDFIRTDDGFFTAWGIPPGDKVSRVLLSYTLPYTGQLHFESQLQYPMQVVQVLLVDQGATLASPQLKEQGTAQREDGKTVRSYTGGAIAANQALVFDLSGIPQLTSVGAATNEPELIESTQIPLRVVLDLRQGIALGIVAFGLILLAIGAVWWVWSRRRAEEEEYGGVPPEHRALVQALASMDEAHDTGKIDDTDYARQRPILKAALMRVLENPSYPQT